MKDKSKNHSHADSRPKTEIHLEDSSGYSLLTVLKRIVKILYGDNEKYIINCVGVVSTLFVFELLVIANNSDRK